jgi:hypothetical protein
VNLTAKSVLMIGTAHDFQTVGNPCEKQFYEMLASVVSNYKIQIILEEWNDSRGTAIGKTLMTPQLRWENVGTQDFPEYDTSTAKWINFDPYQPVHLMLRDYPYEVQEKREEFMVERIKELMIDYERGLFVVGMAHLHSMMTKLRMAGFDIESGNWLRIPGNSE